MSLEDEPVFFLKKKTYLHKEKCNDGKAAVVSIFNRLCNALGSSCHFHDLTPVTRAKELIKSLYSSDFL